MTRDAIQAAKGGDYHTQKGMTMAVMGDALSRYSEVKDRRDNLARAVRLYEASLEILKDGEESEERERVKRRLAETLGEITGVGEGANGREGEGT